MRRRIRLLSLLAPLLALVGAASAQPTPTDVQRFGAPHHPVRGVLSIVEDARGFLWMGTRDGIVRFDGQRFQTVYTSEGPPGPARIVGALHIDPQGTLWAGTAGGVLLRFDARAGTFEPFTYTLPGPQRPEFTGIDRILDDGQGGLWLTGRSGSPVRHFTVKGARFRHARTDTLAQMTRMPLSAALDAKGNLWVGFTGGGVVRLSPDGTTRHWPTLPGVETPYPPNVALSVLVTRRGDVWVGLDAGTLARYDTGTNRFVVYPNPHASPRDPRSGVTRLFERPDGALLAGDPSGRLYHFSPETGAYSRVPFPEGAPSDWASLHPAMDQGGRLWLPSMRGMPAVVSAQGPEVIPFTEGLLASAVFRMFQDRSGRYWWSLGEGDLLTFRLPRLEGETGLLRLPLPSGVRIRDLATAPDGSLYASGASDVFQMDFETGVVRPIPLQPDSTGRTPYPRALAHDGKALWVSTTAGLTRISHLDGRQRNYTVHAPDGVWMPLNALALAADGAGALWKILLPPRIGSELLVRYVPGDASYEVRPLSVSGHAVRPLRLQRSPDGHVRILAEGPEGSLHLFTTLGASVRHAAVLDAGGRGPRHLPASSAHFWSTRAEVPPPAHVNPASLPSTDAGSPVVGFGIPANHASDGPEKLFVGERWAYRSHDDVLERLPLEALAAPPDSVLLTEIFVPARPPDRSHRVLQEAWPAEPVYLEAHERALSLSFTDLQFGPEGQGQDFEVRVLGQSETWNLTGQSRTIALAGFSAGRYEVQVRRAGAAEAEAGITVVVARPAWQSPWVLLPGGILLIALLVGARYLYQRPRRAEAAVRKRIADDLHDTLGARMSSVALMLDAQSEALPAPESAWVRRTAGMARGAVDDLREAIWLIDGDNDEHAGLARRMEQVAYEVLQPVAHTVKLVLEAPEGTLGLDARRDALLIVREALANALRHGGGGHVDVSIVVRGRSLEVDVCNDGGARCPEAPASDGRGLRTMRERAARHGWSLQVQSEPGAGTRVTLRLTSV